MKDQESTIRKRSEPPPEVLDNIVKRAKVNPEAFGELYGIFVDSVYSYVYYRVGWDSQDAEDLTAKIFFKALNRIQTYEKEKNVPFAAWLLRIAHNSVCNFRRDEGGRRRRTVLLDHPPKTEENDGEDAFLWEHIAEEGSLSPEEIVINNQKKEETIGIIKRARLSDREGELLVLKYTLRFSDREIGESTGRTFGAVKAHHHRILVKLRRVKR